MNRDKLNDIMDLCSEELKGIHLRCIETRWNAHDKKLQIFIDFWDALSDKDNPLEIELCVQATKLLNECSKLDDMFSGTYEMEVSSPGVERPIRLDEDFRRLVGKEIHAHLNTPLEGSRNWQGVIVEAKSAGQVELETKDGLKQIPFGQLLKANLVYDWNRVEIY